MRKALFALLCFSLPALALGGVNRWTSGGPEGGWVGNLVFDPANSATIYAALQHHGVFKSVDGGMNWFPSGLQDRNITALAADPFHSGVLWAGASNESDASGDVFKSVDGGSSWVPVASVPLSSDPAAILFGDTPGTIYVLCGGYVVRFGFAGAALLKSLDDGATWANVLPSQVSGGEAGPIAQDPAHRDTLYLGGYPFPGLLKSIDGGGTWQALSIDAGLDAPTYSIAVALSDREIVYIDNFPYLYKSADAGNTWTKLSFSIGVAWVVVDPTDAQDVIAAAYGLLYRSRDGGASWALVQTVPGDVQQVWFDPSNSSRIFLATRSALWLSSDGGASWQRSQSGLGGGPAVSSVAAAPDDPETIYASDDDGVWKSQDDGNHWQRASNGLPAAAVNVVRVAFYPNSLHPVIPSNSRTLYAGTASGVFKSADAAASWQPSGLSGLVVRDLEIPPLGSSPLYAIASESEASPSQVFESADGGLSWSLASDGIPFGPITGLAIDPSAPNTAYASASGNLFKTTNGGIRWTSMGGSTFPTDVNHLIVDPSNPMDIFAATPYQVFLSQDGGASWAPLPTVFNGINSILLTHGVLYIGTSNWGLLASHDGGKTWTRLGLLPATTISSLAADGSGARLHAGTLSGEFDLDLAPGAATITIPAVASLHGRPPAFFHSDLHLTNLSQSSSTSVEATYRCTIGACGSIERTIALEPGQSLVFENVVATLFGAPETGGVIELETDGAVTASSRLYTPEIPTPTVGQFVPGLAATDASPRLALTSLSHSDDPNAGFRTNIGVYNGNDQATEVTVDLYDPAGRPIGELVRNLAPRSGTQINDDQLFTYYSGPPPPPLNHYPSFYCVVTANPPVPIFAYATVIDSQSQDPIFVPGQDIASPPPVHLVLPAVASLHGVPPTHYHSDVQILNPSTDQTANVALTYHCIGAACGDSIQRVPVAPMQQLDLDQIVSNLFHSSETRGWVEVESNVGIVATSRLFTPEPLRPTLGQFVPGLDRRSAAPEVLLTRLSHSADPTRGFRTNLLVDNVTAQSQKLILSFYLPDGSKLKDIVFPVDSYGLFQINDDQLAALLGLTSDLPDFSCYVRGDLLSPVIAGAAVIDNQSQDPIFVVAQPAPLGPRS
jgi:photosystem II stability/assembly factor-like uncharacterized protein